MQLTPRYLVDNRITIIANDAGFITEYRPVYHRHVKIFKGIDNKLTFRALNADSKPIDISNYTTKFVAYDENKRLVIEHTGTLVTGDDSAASRGLFNVTITENDLLNIDAQYLSYNVYLVDSNNEKTLTYSNSHFDGCGTLYLDDCQFPGPAKTTSVTNFSEVNGDAGIFVTESIDAQPAINGNEALHTAVFYTNEFAGDVIIEGTLENQVTNDTAWAELKTVSFDGSSEDEPVPANFNGVISYIRFKTTTNPSNKITKILIRN